MSGVRKGANQDAYCYLEAEGPKGSIVFASVCDGVGGFKQGELASSIVIKRLVRWFEIELPRYIASISSEENVGLSGLSAAWLSMLQEENERILAYGDAHGMALGTTFSGIVVYDGSFFIGHVGDCRVYRYSAGLLQRLTDDQTWVAEQVAAGLLPEDDALQHPQSNVILQAVGTQRELAPSFFSGMAGPDDLFVLCCDGLYRDIPEDELAVCFARMQREGSDAMGRSCSELVQRSIDCGSNDDITIVAFAMGGQKDGADESFLAGARRQTEAFDEEDASSLADDSATIITQDSRTVLVPTAGPQPEAREGVDR